MDSQALSWKLLPLQCAFATAALFGAVACGGGGDRSDSLAADAATAVAVAVPQVIPPLRSDDGTALPSDPRAVPADAAAWTGNGLYATAEQARQLVAALGDGVLEVRVACCGLEAVELASGVAFGLQAAHDLPPDTPVLVYGLDLRLAAATANRLSGGGLTHVWLVTP